MSDETVSSVNEINAIQAAISYNIDLEGRPLNAVTTDRLINRLLVLVKETCGMKLYGIPGVIKDPHAIRHGGKAAVSFPSLPKPKPDEFGYA